MRIDFTGRGVDITDRIRTFTKGKLERLAKHLDDIQDVTVVLSVEKYRQKAEVKFLSKKRAFHCTEETSDMFGSIDRAVEKLETQVKKFKEKKTTLKRNTTESIRHHVITPPDREEETAGEAELKIIRTDNSVVKPMSLDEAVDELTKLDQEFIIFRNHETDRVNVVYRRNDGNIGYIEPDA
ncbi:ribosome hibernation-promoting factor, HPF/YfiA family [Acanthopleuribacter pedis]|uniref:Ribosome hibernation promoting factor n=1 Tax=Acanthopleuribacter pedis TaxID=442870 RepID=A0A8J7Q5D4_9BACT|nr:ribosome-associated translation inhibitor RaiA [Acanthopleuribacter pedis]MBO1318432.1 ribosome-associated translation inhibitor RaiA [Acanthopleuribacter pedis]